MHFRASDGKLKDIDNTLVADGAGLRNAAGPLQVKVAASADSAELFSVGTADKKVTLAMEGARASAVKAVGPVATYASVAEGVDLELHVNADSVKETLVLHQAPAAAKAARYRFRLDPAGLNPVTSPSGGIELRDAKGTVVAVLPAPVMFDSAVDPKSSEPTFGPATMTLTQEGGRWIITLEADGTWLAQPERKWPVYLDPSVIWVDGPDDAFVMSAYPNQNYNVSWSPTLGRYEDKIGYYDGTTGWTESYLRYNTAALAGKQILSASWNGYFIWSYYPNTETLYRLNAVAGAWSPGTLTFNNRPALRADAVQGLAVRNQWRALDITTWVNNWQSGAWANNGIMIDTAGQGTTSWKKLAANENTDGSRSFLAVTYNVVPTVSPVAPANGTYTHSLTPSLTVSTSDADGPSPTYVAFLVCLDAAGNSCIWNSGWTTATTVSVPANLLAYNNSTVYYWRAYGYDGTGVYVPNWSWWFYPVNSQPSAPNPPSTGQWRRGAHDDADADGVTGD